MWEAQEVPDSERPDSERILGNGIGHAGEAATETIRIFIALRLDSETRRRLVAVQDQLRDESRRIKWVSFDNLHLTLKFLGEISPNALAPVYDAVRTAAGSSPGAAFTIRGLGVFPPRGMPRVIWAGVEERNPTLGDLQASLEDGLRALGFAREIREKRRFSPHVTLGRVRSKPGFDKGSAKGRAAEWTARVNAFLARNAESVFGEEAIHEISVIRSRLGPKGPAYEDLERFELAG